MTEVRYYYEGWKRIVKLFLILGHVKFHEDITSIHFGSDISESEEMVHLGGDR